MFIRINVHAAKAVDGHDVRTAIVVDVTNRETTPDNGRCKLGAGLRCGIFEALAIDVSKQLTGLLEDALWLDVLGVVHHVAICGDDVEEAIVVDIDHPQAEGYERTRRESGIGWHTDIREQVGAIVVVEGHRLRLECRHREVKLAIVVVVAPVHTHPAVHLAIHVVRRAGARPHV